MKRAACLLALALLYSAALAAECVPLDKVGQVTAATTSAQTKAHLLVDGDLSTYWRSAFGVRYPHSVVLYLQGTYPVCDLKAISRADKTGGAVKVFRVETSMDGYNWAYLPASTTANARYLRWTALASMSDGNRAAMAELVPYVTVAGEPDPEPEPDPDPQPGPIVTCPAGSWFCENFNDLDWDGSWKGHGFQSFATTGCQEGAGCGVMSQPARLCDQNLFWAQDLKTNPSEIYIKGWYLFPTSWRFAGWSNTACSVCGQSGDWKAFIIETADERYFLNFRTKEPSPNTQAEISFTCCTNNVWLSYDQGGTKPHITADGQWHMLEMYIERRVGNNAGRVKVWFDGKLYIDRAHTTCKGGSCDQIGEVKFPGYCNWAPCSAQTFKVDSFSIGAARP